MTAPVPMTEKRLEEIEANKSAADHRAHDPEGALNRAYLAALKSTADVPELVAEVRRLRAELATSQRVAKGLAMAALEDVNSKAEG